MINHCGTRTLPEAGGEGRRGKLRRWEEEEGRKKGEVLRAAVAVVAVVAAAGDRGLAGASSR